MAQAIPSSPWTPSSKYSLNSSLPPLQPPQFQAAIFSLGDYSNGFPNDPPFLLQPLLMFWSPVSFWSPGCLWNGHSNIPAPMAFGWDLHAMMHVSLTSRKAQLRSALVIHHVNRHRPWIHIWVWFLITNMHSEAKTFKVKSLLTNEIK